MIDKDFATRRGMSARRVRRPAGRLFTVALLCAFGPSVWANDALTLSEAFERTLADNPELRVFDWRQDILAGRRRQADQTPGFELGLDTESLIGTGDLGGFDGAEVAVSLSSVFELGDKRRKRTQAIDSRRGQLDADAEARAMGWTKTTRCPMSRKSACSSPRAATLATR